MHNVVNKNYKVVLKLLIIQIQIVAYYLYKQQKSYLNSSFKK